MKKKMNNKGFSLVELIIVIAIMAVLVGVLAPTYLKFVERSRKSTDAQNVDAIVTALEVYALDPTIASGSTLSSGAITLTTTETAVSSSNATGNADKALAAAGISKIGLKSAKWTSGGTIKLNVTVGTDGTVTVAVDSSTAMINANHDILTGKYE